MKHTQTYSPRAKLHVLNYIKNTMHYNSKIYKQQALIINNITTHNCTIFPGCLFHFFPVCIFHDYCLFNLLNYLHVYTLQFIHRESTHSIFSEFLYAFVYTLYLEMVK